MFFSLRRSLTHTHLEPLTYLLYNHQGLRMKYVLGCDTLVYHSILFTPSMYFEQDSGERYARHLAPEVPILSQRILLPGFESGIHDKLWHRSTPSCTHYQWNNYSLYPSNSKMLLSLNTNTLLKSKDEYVNKLLQLRTSIYKKNYNKTISKNRARVSRI